MASDLFGGPAARAASFAVFALVTAWSLPAPAAQDSGWVGRRVVSRMANLELKVGDEVVAVEVSHHIFTVEQVDGPWLWISCQSTKGWVKASEILAFEQAADYYADLIRQDPNSAWAYAMRGVIRQDKDEIDNAIADYNDALRLDPSLSGIWNNRGHAWASKHDYTRAVADYDEAIRRHPSDSQYYLNRGNAWAAQGKFNRAIGDYGEAIVHDPEPSMAYNNRGYAWLRQRDVERAVTDFTRAVQLNPKLLLAYHNRSMAWELKGDAARALADHDEVLRLDPKDWWAHNARAWIRATWPDAKFRDGKRAVEDASLACELTHWIDPAPLDTLAAAQAEAGDFAKAVETQLKALALPAADPDRDARRARLEGYRRNKPYHHAPDPL